MNVVRSDRGFETLEHPTYLEGGMDRVVGQSSAIGNYDDAFDRPGSSFLWLGDRHHLNRGEVRQLVAHLRHWLETGYLTIGRKQERTV